MKIIKIKLNNITNKGIKIIADNFKQGNVIAYPTDTIYGLGCMADNAITIDRIHKIKNQPPNKPLLVLVSDYKMLLHYCFVNAKQKKYLKLIWPGPVTVILKLKKKMPAGLSGGLNTLAVRLPKNDFLIKIIKMVGTPIVSTSLNIVGKKPLNSVTGLNKYFKKDKPDLVVDAGKIMGQPSKLVDITNIENIKILRK